MSRVRIGLIGAGWMGTAHALSFRTARQLFGPDDGDPDLVAVADIDQRLAERAAQSVGFSRVEASWEQIVRSDDIDLVDVATPNSSHYEIVKAALGAGKHVYCEKPLTIVGKQSIELSEIAATKGVVNYVGYNNVVNPAVAYVRQLIAEDTLGEIIRFEGTYQQDSLLDAAVPFTWRHSRAIAGSGALGDLGGHLLSISQILLGDVEEVAAVSKTTVLERSSNGRKPEMRKVENDDTMSVLVRYRTGANGILSASRVATGRKNHLGFEIQGTKGAVRYSLERMNEVYVYFVDDNPRDRGFRQVFLSPEHPGYKAFYPAGGIAIGYNDMKVIEAHSLMSAIVSGADYDCTFSFGARIDSTIDAILEADEIHGWVGVEREAIPSRNENAR